MPEEQQDLRPMASVKIHSMETFNEGYGIARVILDINSEVFRRVYERGLPVCWIENNTNVILEGQKAKDLESIFRAFCLEHKLQVDPVSHPHRLRKR